VNAFRTIAIVWTIAFAAIQASGGQKAPTTILFKNVRIFNGNHAELTPPSDLLALSRRRNPYQKKFGVIEPGAYADLLLVNGNPLEDITLLGRPDKSLAVIVKNGAVIKNIVVK
jgi:hypothetical protein